MIAGTVEGRGPSRPEAPTASAVSATARRSPLESPRRPRRTRPPRRWRRWTWPPRAGRARPGQSGTGPVPGASAAPRGVVRTPARMSPPPGGGSPPSAGHPRSRASAPPEGRAGRGPPCAGWRALGGRSRARRSRPPRTPPRKPQGPDRRCGARRKGVDHRPDRGRGHGTPSVPPSARVAADLPPEWPARRSSGGGRLRHRRRRQGSAADRAVSRGRARGRHRRAVRATAQARLRRLEQRPAHPPDPRDTARRRDHRLGSGRAVRERADHFPPRPRQRPPARPRSVSSPSPKIGIASAIDMRAKIGLGRTGPVASLLARFRRRRDRGGVDARGIGLPSGAPQRRRWSPQAVPPSPARGAAVSAPASARRPRAPPRPLAPNR